MDKLKNKKLQKIARCPKCRSDLQFDDQRIKCVSADCGQVYGFERNVPVLITLEEREKIRNFLSRHAAQTVPAINTKTKARLFPPNQTWDPRRRRRMPSLWKQFDDSAVIVDVGAATASLRSDVINLDLAPFKNVDVVGYALRLPFADDSVDFLVNTGVLEHVESIPAALSEFHRVLRPGGLLYTEIPFMQGFHPDPTDFERLTYQGLTRDMSQFHISEMEVSSGPFSNISWTLREAFASFCSKRHTFTWSWILMGWLTFWVKYLDRFVVGKPYAHRFASSYYVIATKNGETH